MNKVFHVSSQFHTDTRKNMFPLFLRGQTDTRLQRPFIVSPQSFHFTVPLVHGPLPTVEGTQHHVLKVKCFVNFAK